MKNKPSQEKYVTQTSFNKEVKGLHQKIDTSTARLDQNIKELHQKIDTSTARLDQNIKELHQKIDTSTARLDQNIKELHQKVDTSTARLDQKIDTVTARLDQKIDNVALSLVKTNDRLERVENTMATKNDVQIILNHIDAFTKKVFTFEQEEGVQSLHLQEVKQKVDNHEKRLTILESSR